MSTTTTTPETTAVAKVEPQPRAPIALSQRGVLLQSFEDLQRFSKMVMEAGAAPKGIDSVGKVATAIQMGMERGLSPLAGLRAVYFVNGLPSWRGEAALALVRSSGVCRPGYPKAFVEGEGENRRGVCITQRVDQAEPRRTEFTVKEAVKAKLWAKEGPWQQYPDRMLQWRAVGFNLDDNFSDVLGGFPIGEVAQDWPADAVARVAEASPAPALAAAPEGPDPLLASVIDGTAVPVEPELVGAPFASHAEADAALAAEEAAERARAAEPDPDEKGDAARNEDFELRPPAIGKPGKKARP